MSHDPSLEAENHEQDHDQDKKGKPGFLKKIRGVVEMAALGAASLGSPAEAELPQLPQTELAPSGEKETKPAQLPKTELAPLGDKELANFFERFGIVRHGNLLRLPDGYKINYDDLDTLPDTNPPQLNVRFYFGPIGHEGHIKTVESVGKGIKKVTEYVIYNTGRVEKSETIHHKGEEEVK